MNNRTVWLGLVLIALCMVMANCGTSKEAKRAVFESFPGTFVTDYSFVVDDLSHFKDPQSTYRTVLDREYEKKNLLGTWVGMRLCLEYGYLHYNIVTKDRQLVIVSIKGSERELAMLAEKICPRTGKYKHWKPLLKFPAVSKEIHYDIKEIDIVGRYRGRGPFLESEIYYEY